MGAARRRRESRRPPKAAVHAIRARNTPVTEAGAERGEETDAVLASAAALGLDVHAIAEQLQEDEIQECAASSEQLLASLAEKRCHMLTSVS